MPFKIATANKILDKILKNTDFTHPAGIVVSLHDDDPGQTGDNEIGGGDYERKSVTFTVASGKVAENTNALEWEGMPACTVTHVGLWDTAAEPNFWWSGALIASKTLDAGDTFRIKAGDLVATLI